MNKPPFSKLISPDWESFIRCLSRQEMPRRVYFIELFIDSEMKEAISDRFGLLEGLNPNDPHFALQREIALQRFLGYDYVRCGVDDVGIQIERMAIRDTAALQRGGGRQFVNEHCGPITSWAEFESYPWPDPASITTQNLQWYQENLPEDMCIIGSGGFAHFAEYLTWLMGYETLCFALFDQRDLVSAISQRLVEIYEAVVKGMLQFNRVSVIWGSDDMGFRSGTLISPRDLRVFVLPGHRAMAQAAHAAGRLYLLHSCGKLDAIMDDLLEDVQIDALHSFEDTIRDVREAKKLWGDRIALLGGIDMDFLCRASTDEVRQRVRNTLDTCLPGGGYCLGTGNSVANYLPMDNYLAMLDEVESLSPSLPTTQRRRTSYMTERLISEVLDPGLEPALWEVALDIITKAARSQEERGMQATELVTKLSPELHAYFESPGEVVLQEITEKTVFGVILLSETLTEPKGNFVAPKLLLSCGEGEGSPEGFYAKIGFTRTGKVMGDEVVMRYGL